MSDQFIRFLQTPQGKTFTLQQTLLQVSKRKKTRTRIYNLEIEHTKIIAKQDYHKNYD